MKKFKTKKKPVCEAVVCTIEVDNDERSRLIHEFQKGHVKIEYEGSEYQITKIHPKEDPEQMIIKLTIKPV